MMKHTPENLDRQAKLVIQLKKDKKRLKEQGGGKAGTTTIGSRAAEEPSSKRRRGASGAVAADVPEAVETMAVPIPDKLKLKMLDDWNFVTRQNRLVSLPRESPLTISGLLESYCANIKGSGPAAESLSLEVTSGLKAYFESACSAVLLYKQERQQYAEVTEGNPDSDLCSIYGAEHLLRLLVKLPTLISHARIDERGLAHITLCVQDIMKFILAQEDVFFPLEAYV
jgi:mortality factor 4-like protein 1